VVNPKKLPEIARFPKVKIQSCGNVFPIVMILPFMGRLIRIYALFLLSPLFIACTQHQDNQQEIERKAADAAAELKKGVKEFDKDAQSAAKGAKEGWNRDEDNRPHAAATRPRHSNE
jgi:hypothetical protein